MSALLLPLWRRVVVIPSGLSAATADLLGTGLGRMLRRHQRSQTCRSLSGSAAQRSIKSEHPPSSLVVERNSKTGVFLIGINRPQSRNAVDPATAEALFQAFEDFERDDKARVAVLHGGRHADFCAGFDLKALSQVTLPEPEQDAGADDHLQSLGLNRVGQGRAPMGPSRMELSKPLIGAISGHAVAGGLELSLLCDMRIADDTAIFGVFCRRFGVPLIDGGTARLPAVVGLGNAMDMILTGRPVAAEEALRMGLISRIVPRGQVLESAIVVAEQIASFPQQCLKSDRKSAYHATFTATSLQDALAYEFDHGLPIVEREAIAGASRFAQGQGRGGRF